MYLVSKTTRIRIGIVGTGFISRGLTAHLSSFQDLQVTKILTRQNPFTYRDFPFPELLTNSTSELVDYSDIIIECSGNPIHATHVVNEAINCQLPVITMDSEFQITTGSYFVDKGLITEAEGDQPGSLAALAKEARLMGFTPLVYGNIKGYLNQNPTPEEMRYWSKKSGISLPQVTAFTDGTKVQIEQAFIANGLHADITQTGLSGIKADELATGALALGKLADSRNEAISDYVLSAKAPAGVFILATHENQQAPYLQYYKLGDGPHYLLVKNYHLCHLEIPKTIKEVIEKQEVLLNNSTQPRMSVAAIAKKSLAQGAIISRALGSFEIRGEAIYIKEHPHHVPIGLLAHAHIKRPIEEGQIITFDDVDLPDSLALDLWFKIYSTSCQPIQKASKT